MLIHWTLNEMLDGIINENDQVVVDFVKWQREMCDSNCTVTTLKEMAKPSLSDPHVELKCEDEEILHLCICQCTNIHDHMRDSYLGTNNLTWFLRFQQILYTYMIGVQPTYVENQHGMC